MIVDVTDRKRADETIQRSQRILKLFVEHAPAAIAMLDAQMNYISASRRFLADYDLGDQDIIGRSHYEVFPEIPERWKEIHRRCLMGATEQCDEDPFQRTSGKLDWIRWEIRPWFEQTDKIGGIIIFSEVITGQKIAAQALHESEKKFRDLFHKHAAVKLLIDPDTGNIVEANEAAERFYGWSLEQLRRMRIQDINTLSHEQVKAELNKVIERQCIHFEFRHRLADGSVRDVEVFSSSIDINGKVLLHSIIHDITERHNLERQLQQVQKMESVGHLAGGVAHDFNNMLSIILGYTEMALLEAGAGTPLHDNLLEISKAADRSADLTRQLLAFARKQTIQPRVLDLNGTVEGMLKMLRRLIGENINLVWLPGAGLWPVKMDPAQIDQVLANLCVNARDAITITGVGKISIETQNIILDETYCAGHAGFTPGEFVMIAVSDNGCGMDDEIMRRIFDPFFTTKELGKGTGLGLSTVYGIVKQNEGFINVYSEPGLGSNFKIYFPRCAGNMVEARTTRSDALLQGHGETVLLVEDEPAILAMGKEMLEKLSYTMLSAGTPGESLRLAEVYTGEIHLLMTDVIMPEMNGRELAKRFHAIRPGMRCLFMSGYTANVIVHQGILEEGVHFIQKPFSMNDLSVRVRKVLDEGK
jgi:PAS domain S-box-containing protein